MPAPGTCQHGHEPYACRACAETPKSQFMLDLIASVPERGGELRKYAESDCVEGRRVADRLALTDELAALRARVAELEAEARDDARMVDESQAQTFAAIAQRFAAEAERDAALARAKELEAEHEHCSTRISYAEAYAGEVREEMRAANAERAELAGKLTALTAARERVAAARVSERAGGEVRIDYEQLDHGVRKLVRLLREVGGFDTTDSGDGSKAGLMEGALDIPHVHMTCDENHFRRWSFDLVSLLRFHLKPESLGKLEPHAIQFTYSPLDELGILSLYGVCDSDLL